MRKISKAQGGKTLKKSTPTVMQRLKMKYPDVDTTAKGDVRGTEMNAYAPKKVLQKYNDTYDAFDKKYKGGKSYKMGGKVAKAQGGKTLPPVTVNSSTMNRGSKSVQTSPGGAYKLKTTTGPTGNVTRQVERRTLKGLLQGAPKARGVIKQTFKKGGKMSKGKKC